CGFLRLIGLHPEAGGKEERASAANRALYPDPAPHQFDKLPGNRQTQSRATVLARGGAVFLRETLKNSIHLALGNPDAGVGNGEAEATWPAVFRIGLDTYLDPAMFGELDGVAEQIDDHLPQSVWVADEENRNAARNAPPQEEAFCGQAEFDDFQRPGDDFPQIEVHRFQLDFAGFNF